MKVIFIITWIFILLGAIMFRDNIFIAAALLAITFISFQKEK